MSHVVLLGDSIFDNAAYVAGGPDVITHLLELLPEAWNATLAAIDGSVIADVPAQLRRLPRGSTHLVLSMGGNDALGHIDILDRRAGSVAEVLDLLATIRSRFEMEYRDVLGQVLRIGLPVTVCTIYEGALPDAALQRRAATALTHFNDAILRSAFELGAGVIELRLVCRSPDDYANPIEPSVRGGARIAAAIASALAQAPAAGHARSAVESAGKDV